MAFEKGERTDKFGNRYERRYVVFLMIQLLQGNIESFVCEPVGPEESGVDILVYLKDGSKEFHQCKSRNGDYDKWTLSSLRKHKIFEHIAEHVIDNTTKYVFVSPLPFTEFSDLCLQAKNSPSSKCFFESQLNPTRKQFFLKVLKEFNLSESESDIHQCFQYLQNTEFRLVSDDSITAETSKIWLSCMFTGNADDLYNLLLNFTEENYLGKHITSYIIHTHLQSKDHFSRDLSSDKSISKRVTELNEFFAEWFRPIKNELFSTIAVQTILNAVQSKKNVLLLGAPGIGKSGCIQSLINELSKECIPYLSLNLSVYPPHLSSTLYGSNLGFPCSPVMCLESVVPQNSYGILILDQLDSLRWTAAHSPDALLVCKQIIKEAHALSDGTSKSIYVVMASRKFDFENDVELNELYSNSKLTKWEYITLDHWSCERVKGIIGDSIYASLFPRTQKLLQIPSNLYIWLNLDEEAKMVPMKSTMNC